MNMRPAFKALILFLFLGIVIALSAGGSDQNLHVESMDPTMIFLMKIAQTVGVIFLFVLPAIGLALLFFPEKLKIFGLHFAPKLRSLIIVLLLTVLSLPLINWLKELNDMMSLSSALAGLEAWMKASEENLEKITEAFLSGTTISDLMLNLFVIALMAAISEELFFRGLMQNVLRQSTGNKHLAVWLTGIVFSIIHLQFYGFIPRMMLGVMLGYIYLWSGTLWLPILAHFVNNGLAVVVAWLIKRGQITEEVDTVGSHEGQAMYVVISIISVTGLLWMLYKTEKKDIALVE